LSEVFTTEWLFWDAIGLLGVALFGSRWLVQAHASRKEGKPVITATFWWMSLAGSMLLIAYFACSPKRGFVGVLNNLAPAFIATYNLYLGRRCVRQFRKEDDEKLKGGRAS